MRTFDDTNYLERLPSYYRRAHERWKEHISSIIDDVMSALESSTLQEVMSTYNLTPRDIAMLVRLNVVTDEEAERFGMNAVEAVVPL